jgi:chemotaxis signal transduction protein
MADSAPVARKLAELRGGFDRTFAVARSSLVVDRTEDLLFVRVARDPYAIKVRQISGIVPDRKTIAIPSRVSELLGVTAIRGGFVSVYSLAALLGYGPAGHPVRLLVLCGSKEPVALAVSDFEGYFRVSSRQIHAAEQSDATRGCVKQVVRTADAVRAVVDIPDLMQLIGAASARSNNSKE